MGQWWYSCGLVFPSVDMQGLVVGGGESDTEDVVRVMVEEVVSVFAFRKEDHVG